MRNKMSFFVESEGITLSFILYLIISNLFIFNFIFNSILNKITPEKFKKLSKELLGVGLDSPAILKGVILLIFDKALEEPKYSSMYAQLCRIISEEAPNFETSALNSGPLNKVSLTIDPFYSEQQKVKQRL